jgi:hypothetical protein
MSELPRLLAARSEYGYTDRPDRAMRDEPEAVSADAQRQMTRQAALGAAAEARADWHERQARIKAELALVAGQAYARGLSPELRVLERQLLKLDGMIGRNLANLGP